MSPFKSYLGDSVYADFDGYYIILTTENGLPNDPGNVIALEPAVLDALDRYRAKHKLERPPQQHDNTRSTA